MDLSHYIIKNQQTITIINLLTFAIFQKFLLSNCVVGVGVFMFVLMMMIMMMMNFFYGMVDRPLSEVLTIANLQHTTSWFGPAQNLSSGSME